MNPVKVALIGFGHLGKWHAEKAQALLAAELVAIVEPSVEGQKDAIAKFPGIKVVTDIDKVIDDIEAALIVAPTSFHFDICKKLILKDKHVFCEKPLTSTLSQSLDLQKILEKHQVIFQVGHSERFHDVWQTLRESYKNFLDMDLTIHINRVAPFKGRALDVDVVQDLMIHDLDILMFLFGDQDLELKQGKGYRVRGSHWDSACIAGNYGKKVQFSINCGRNGTKEVRSVEILSSLGTIAIDLLNSNYSLAFNQKDEPFVITHQYEKKDHLMVEQELFYQAIQKGKEPVVDFVAGLSAVQLVEQVSHFLRESP